ncbi:hypothetical protein PBF_16634 [Cytobacillus firmus DS1]|uniref:Uncharacterized protein n=1 Tax=Cytobacillus firmus DS1 TaxID=1307436 RepID=W7LDD2_CYTFI|nr:hypothetical protein PBF_16634 [Cytobacillus firmus DS1]
MEGDKVLLKNKLKKGLRITALSLGITAVSAWPMTTAMADSSADTPAQQLVDSLNVMKLDHVDYLYAYLQSVELSENEYSQIKDNTGRANQIIRNTSSIDSLPNSAKLELLRIFMDNIKLLQLDARMVDDFGNEINILNYEPGTTGVKIQLLDRDGNLLAIMDPTREDLSPEVLLGKINALLEAVEALREMSETGVFVPMPAAELPNTATALPNMIMLGGLLIAIGGTALIPAVAVSRKSKKPAEA